MATLLKKSVKLNDKIIIYPFLFFILIAYFTGCKHRADQIPPESYPIIEFVIGDGYIYNDEILPTNQSFSVCLNMKISPGSDVKIKNLTIYRINNNDTVVEKDTLLNSIGETIIFKSTASQIICTELWIFKVIDYSGNEASIDFSISTQIFYPVLTYIFEKDYFQINEDVNLAINAQANQTTFSYLKNLKIKRTFNYVSETVLDTSFILSSISLFRKYAAQPDEGIETWEISIKDAANNSTISTYYIYTVDLMNEEHYGTIWNSMSTNNYAWDLVNNSQKFLLSPDTEKDMANISDSSYSLPPYYFENSWTALNNTLYKRANQLDYDNISLLEAVDAYTGGSITVLPNSSATGLEMGDIYVAKLRNTESYAVIQILSVDKTYGDNMDKIEFRYKK